MSRTRFARTLGTLLLLVSVALAGSSCRRDDGSGGNGSRPNGSGSGSTATSAVLELATGEPVEFDLTGETHTAELVAVEGSSAEVVISSSASTFVVTEGQPVSADLDANALPETTLSVSDVGDDSATLSMAAIETPAYDETGYTTAGGTAPYNVWGYTFVDPALITLDDGSYLLLYTSSRGTRIQWERYSADGRQITEPRLAAGRTAWVPGGASEQADPMDAIRVGDVILVTFRSFGATFIASFDLQMRPLGAPSYLTPFEDAMPLATDGERVWLGTQGIADDREASAGGDAARPSLAVMEVMGARPAMRMSTRVVTDRPAGTSDGPYDIAYDAQTDSLAIAYVRAFHATNTYELRCVVVDAETLDPLRDVLIADDAEFALAAPGTATLLAERGRALVYWETADARNQRISVVDLTSGTVAHPYAASEAEGMAGLSGDQRDVELVQLADGPAVLFCDKTLEATGSGPDAVAARFTLASVTEDGPTGERIVLEGGQPVLADVLFDPAAFGSNPRKAVCGSPCLLRGSVTNRGSRDARGVWLNVNIDGESIGTLEIGTIKPGASTTFAKVWDVPADLTAEQVGISYELTCDTDQYTTDNDSFDTTCEVRQKGVVQGRVTNASGVVDPEWWAGGLAGVTVSFGGKTVLTDAAGVFAIEEVEFGAGTLTATKAGFNPVSLQVETSRTRPIASVGIRMDDHGLLRLRVTDAETGEALSGVTAFLLGFERTDTTDENGELLYNIPAGTYRIAFKKPGYRQLPPTEFTVALGEETAAGVQLEEATSAHLTGRVIDGRGAPVAGASVSIANSQDEVAATATTDENGDFDVGELPTKPSGSYTITASGGGLTVDEPVSLTGGEIASVVVELVPGRGELATRQATEGYTSWMIKAAWPGFMDVSGQSIYVWYGNYAVRIGAQYWDGTRELNRVEVTTWGGTYETHVTKGEIEFEVSGDDLTGTGGKKLPPPMGQATDAASQSWWKKTAKSAVSWYKEHTDAINLAKEIYTGIKDVREAWSGDSEEDWIILGQGPELLTWKQSLEDFNMRPEWDWEHPIDSAKSVKEAIPTSFAIPIVIGGSSVQETAVRVDGIDVVDKETGEVYASSDAVWYSYEGAEDDAAGSAWRNVEIERPGVSVEDVRVFVWVTVQKYWQGAPSGTCFDQREQQVVIFDPDTGGMKAFIAPGDTYRAPERWTTEEIERLQE